MQCKGVSGNSGVPRQEDLLNKHSVFDKMFYFMGTWWRGKKKEKKNSAKGIRGMNLGMFCTSRQTMRRNMGLRVRYNQLCLRASSGLETRQLQQLELVLQPRTELISWRSRPLIFYSFWHWNITACLAVSWHDARSTDTASVCKMLCSAWHRTEINNFTV